MNPDDVQSMVHDVLRHRLILSFEAEANGITTDQVIDELIQQVPVAGRNKTMNPRRFDQALQGAYITLDDLIAARFAARDLKLKQRRNALSLLAGPNKTSFRGRGLDFAEVRAYQAGDDVRNIDWRVTARSGKPYTKLFQEERERPLLVVTDQRQPMFFGSQHCFKSVTACYVSALLAWSGLQQGDRVGGMVFGNEDQLEIRPKRNRQTVMALMQGLLGYNGQLNRDTGLELDSHQRLSSALTELRRIAKPGHAIYLVSDFSGFEHDSVKKQLFQLSRHCEVTAIHIGDPMEAELPPEGFYTISNGQTRQNLFTGKSLRLQYRQQFEQRIDQLHQSLAKMGIPLIELNTSQHPLKRLLEFYGVQLR